MRNVTNPFPSASGDWIQWLLIVLVLRFMVGIAHGEEPAYPL